MKKNYEVILFDLDGTLTDSGPGIVNGFEYAITKMGGTVEDRSSLRRFVGPPLEESFGKILGYSKEDTQKAITIYREYYFGKGGIFENEVYPGVEDMLKELKQTGKKLAVATSKVLKGTILVLEHFGLNQYFNFISATNDVTVVTKEDVIRQALEHYGIEDTNKVLMVGDRKYDIEAANKIGIDSVGVLWGYGGREELETSGATYIVESPEEVLSLVKEN